jgi:hypothetical protein
MMQRISLVLLLLVSTFLSVIAQNVPSPKSHFGFAIGDNYHLANFTETEAYLKKVATSSNKVKLQSIGKTEEGREQYMVIVSDPANLAKLEKYKSISQRLARAEGLTDAQAKALSAEGKAVVWIDGGLHATEVVGIHQWIESLYQIITRSDEETKNILKSTIILFVHANPDGQELVSNWYMRNADTLKRSYSSIPKLYQKYIGHDNNRDFYMTNMSESKNMSYQQYIEWMPQILYNHHQTGPPGTVVAGPPYRDPFNYVYDPLLITGIDALGAAMSSRLNAENKPGYTMKGGSQYSTWWNGGLRTTAYYHNIIGLLTEIIGSPTPSKIPFVADRLVPNSGLPFPIAPQQWLFKNSIDYSVSLNYAVLNYAARHKDEVLMNIYNMGKHAIDAGNKDFWTLNPSKVEIVKEAMKTTDTRAVRTDSASLAYYDKIYKNPTLRDPRGYIIPITQTTTAVDFVNILIKSGIRVEKATADFTVAGKKYMAGSFVVKTNQAFRPHVIDMFEPQDHPNDFLYPGGPPVRPYDAAGWTPAYTMGLEFDRVLDVFDGPFTQIPYGVMQKATGTLQSTAAAVGYTFSTKENAAFILLNDLLKAGVAVLKSADLFFVENNATATPIVEKAVTQNGVNITAVATKPSVSFNKISAKRIALWDTYGGSMPSGWTRWIFEQYHFPFSLVFVKEIDLGNLKNKFDVIVFVGGAIPAARPEAGGFGVFEGREPNAADIPTEYQYMLGRITPAKSIPALKAFLEAGGDIVTIGSSANLAYHLNLPVKNALVEMVNGVERSLPGEKFYIPGSVMQVAVDKNNKANWGIGKTADVLFNSSPVFNLSPDAIANGEVLPLAWYPSAKTLRSGWAYGQSYLQDGVAAFEAKVGKGKLYVYGPEITFRGQTHGTYKMLFNQLFKAE